MDNPKLSDQKDKKDETNAGKSRENQLYKQKNYISKTILIFSYNDSKEGNSRQNMCCIEHVAEIVFKNDQFTTSGIFEFTSNKDSNDLNVYENYKKVFAAMKFIDYTNKIITNFGKTFENLNEFPEV